MCQEIEEILALEDTLSGLRDVFSPFPEETAFLISVLTVAVGI